MLEIFLEMLYVLGTVVDLVSGIKSIKYLKDKKRRKRVAQEFNESVKGKDWLFLFLVLTPIIVVWSVLKFLARS